MANEPRQLERPRLTLVTRLYHQVPGVPSKGPAPTGFSLFLESDESAYERRVKVGEEWEPLDIGWVRDVGVAMVYLVNSVGRVKDGKTPTEDQLDEHYGKVLQFGVEITELHIVEPTFQLMVGQDLPISLLSPEKCRVRCLWGKGQYTVFAVPR